MRLIISKMFFEILKINNLDLILEINLYNKKYIYMIASDIQIYKYLHIKINYCVNEICK